MTIPDLALINDLPSDASHHDAERLLRSSGWTPCGEGDWAFALSAPDGSVVARISPFDPVGPYTARLYREAAGTGLVPILHRHRRLEGGGDLQVMERLHPVPIEDAKRFLAQVHGRAPGFSELAERIESVHQIARQDLPWCGPLDSNPSNIMRTSTGRLVLCDPFYADGRSLYDTAERDPDRVARLIPEDQRRWMTEIPLAGSGPWPAEQREAMRAAIREADERRIT